METYLAIIFQEKAYTNAKSKILWFQFWMKMSSKFITYFKTSNHLKKKNLLPAEKA